MGRLNGKTAIILGGGQTSGSGVGNGRAISIRFAQEGANVMVVARHAESAKGTIECLDDSFRNNCSAFVGDISKEGDVVRIFEECIKRYGQIDIVVNNVGIADYDTSFFNLNFANHERIMKNNVEGALYCFKHIYEYMRPKGGSIIQITLIAGSMTTGDALFSYSSSKHMMKYLGEMMAASYAKDGIRVNNIVLGYVNTPLVINRGIAQGKSCEEVINERNKKVPLRGGAGDAWDTANAAVFLASDESKFITGASIPVDGGMLVCEGRC